MRQWVAWLLLIKSRVMERVWLRAATLSVHLAGVASKSNVIRGVPRLKELLKVTKNPKATSLKVYLRPDIRASKTDAQAVLLDLELTSLRDLTLTARIYLNPKPDNVSADDKDFVRYVNAFNARMAAARGDAPPGAPGSPSQWILRLELDREKMLEKSVSMEDIALALGDVYSGKLANTIYTDTNYDRLVLRIPLDGVASVKDTDHLQTLRAVQNNILDNTIIRGVPGIAGVTMEHIEFGHQIEEMRTARGEAKKAAAAAVAAAQAEYDAAEWKPIDEWILYTNGSNFLEVMNHPSVDGTRLTSNNVWEIYENLGIEATRTVLFNELLGLFEEAYVNSRHLLLLVDVMTAKGKLMPIDRYGINKNDIGPLAKACFEETEDILLRAAIYGELDPVVGVSANIMMGQPFRGGTAFSQILLDVPELMRLNAERPGERELVDYDTRVDDELRGVGDKDARAACAQLPAVVPVTLPKEAVNQRLDDIMDELDAVIV